MRVSELVAASGIPLATVKYYLREGLLMPGVSTSATQADYGEKHLERLALIKALAGTGLPIDRIKTVLGLIEHPRESLYETLGRAISSLPPYLNEDESVDYPLARSVMDQLGQVYDPSNVAVGQLDRALRAAADVGIPMTEDRVEVYGRHVQAIAEYDIHRMPDTAPAAVEYSVLGTAIYEPIIAAMRRLAHQDVVSRAEERRTT
jgi:DNA-binding transcriptional MerR regulator